MRNFRNRREQKNNDVLSDGVETERSVLMLCYYGITEKYDREH